MSDADEGHRPPATGRRAAVGFVPAAVVVTSVAVALFVPHAAAVLLLCPVALVGWALTPRFHRGDQPVPVDASLSLAVLVAPLVVVLWGLTSAEPGSLAVAVVCGAITLPVAVRSALALVGRARLSTYDALPTFGIALVGGIGLVIAIPVAITAPSASVELLELATWAAWVVLAGVAAAACLRDGRTPGDGSVPPST